MPAKSCDFEVVGMKPFNCTTRGFWEGYVDTDKSLNGQKLARIRLSFTWGPNNYSSIQIFVRICINPQRDENGCFQIRWCHACTRWCIMMYSACSVRNATVLPFFSVFLWTGEYDSNGYMWTHIYIYFFFILFFFVLKTEENLKNIRIRVDGALATWNSTHTCCISLYQAPFWKCEYRR